MGQITVSNQTSIDTPSTGKRTLAPKSDGWYEKDDTGTESKLNFDAAEVPQLNNVYVSMDGDNSTGDGKVSSPFRNIKNAAGYISANYTVASDNPYMIKVAAGYYEEAPFTLPEFVGISGEGYRTQVKATTSGSDLITAEGSHTIKGVVLYGVTGAGNYLVKCSISKSARIAFEHVAFNPYKVTSGTVSNGVYLQTLSGLVTAEFESVDFDQIVGNCVYLGGGAEMVGKGINIFTCASATFLNANNDSKYSIDSLSVVTSLALGLNHNTTGAGALNNVDFRNASSPLTKLNDATLLVQGSAGKFNDATVSTLAGFKGYFFDEIEGEDTFRVIDEMSVGVPGIGKELCVGEGDSYVNGMLVYTYDNTTYTDVTEEASSSSGSTFTFPSSGTTRELYVSTQRVNGDTGDFLTFQGVKIDVETAASSDGEFIAEYWDGSSWTEFNTMSNEASGSYYPYAKALFERTGSEQIRYTKLITEDWAKNDPVGHGTNLYWMRFRADTVPTTLPVFQKLKVHSNRTEINSDGYIEYFGEARPVLSFSLPAFQSANNSPGNADLYFQSNFGAGYIENNFANGAVDQSSQIVYLPSSACTACPLRLKVILTPLGTSTSQSDWTIRWVVNKEGDYIYDAGGAPSSNPNVQSVNVSASPTGEYEQFTLEAELDISDYIADNTDGKPDVLGIQIQRNGNTDANSSNIALAAANIFYAKVNEGSHI